jgi:hypothetical protein
MVWGGGGGGDSTFCPVYIVYIRYNARFIHILSCVCGEKRGERVAGGGGGAIERGIECIL